MILTQDKLKSLLHYNPETGVFIWIKENRRGIRGNGIAGSLTDNGYLNIGISGTLYRAHRLAWFYMIGEWPENDIDHINHKRTDNRWVNLRVCTRSQNLRNALKRPGCSSKHKGVSWFKGRDKWEAYIDFDGRRKKLGYFDNERDAAVAYNENAIAIFGEFACLNEPL